MEKSITITIDSKTGTLDMKSSGMSNFEIVGILETLKNQFQKQLSAEFTQGNKPKE